MGARWEEGVIYGSFPAKTGNLKDMLYAALQIIGAVFSPLLVIFCELQILRAESLTVELLQ